MTMIGQGISIAFGDSLVQGHASNTKDIEAYIEVRNDGAADVEIKVTRRFDFTNALVGQQRHLLVRLFRNRYRYVKYTDHIGTRTAQCPNRFHRTRLSG